MDFLLELRQRKVCRAAVVYAVVVWLVFQVAEIVIPALHLPEWALGFIVLLGILGFPIALILAWIFEITPTGLVMDQSRSGSKSRGTSIKRELTINCVLLTLAALISVQLVMASSSNGSNQTPVSKPTEHVHARTVIVMPFVSAGSTPASMAIGGGIADELRHLLRREGAMNVVAWDVSGSSQMNPKDNAEFLIQGSINADYDPIRVTVRLVNLGTGYDVWSDVLEESRNSMVSLQAAIARKVFAELPIASGGNNQASLYAKSTAMP